MGGSTSSNTLNESPAIEISAKIILAAVIFLFMVVLFVILLHLYAKWFWWRIEEETTAPPPRRNRRRRFVFAPGQDSVTSDGTQQLGLDPEVLKSLPVLVFKPEEFKDGLECTVCLSEIVQGEQTRLLPKCNHGFHVDCIDMWFHSHSTCPLCRNLVASSDSESSKLISSSNAADGFSRNSESVEAENSAAVSDIESQNFPTNVLVWGNPTQVTTSACTLTTFMEESTSEQPPCSSLPTSSSSRNDGSNSGCHEMLVIDIPSEFTSSSLSPSSENRCDEDEMKSPMSAKFRSFKKLLSRDKKLTTCSPGSMDVEQA